MSDLAKALQKIVGVKDTVRMFDAEVTSVDQTNRTCVVTMIGGESSNTITVRLMAGVDDGAYLIPKAGSTVIVTMSDYVQPYVSMFSEVESIIWLGGDYAGVPIVKHPTDVNKGLLKKINNLESLLNDFISKYNAHRHITSCGAGAGSANAPAPPDTETTTITPITAQIDIEHQFITH